jgi:hypothetical protein
MEASRKGAIMNALAKAERYREFPVGSRLVVNSCALGIAVAFAICSALLGACAAGPTEPATASTTGAVLTDNVNAPAQNQAGELRFMVIAPEALAGGMAQADKVAR